MALTQKEYEELLNDGEKKLERLRSAYEQYFQGMEKLQPATQFKAVERIFYVLLREKPRSTNLRFRANQLIQKWSTYQMYWKRVCRQIEEGTHKKQIEKAKARRAAREAEARGEKAEATESTALEGAEAASPAESKALPSGKTETGAWEIDPNDNFELDMDEFRHDSESKAREPRPKSAPPAKPKSAPPAKAEAETARENPAPPEAKQPSSPPAAAAPGGYKPPTPGSVQTKKDQTASRGVRLPPPGSKPTGAVAAPAAPPPGGPKPIGTPGAQPAAAAKPASPPTPPAKAPVPPAPPKVAAAVKPPAPPGLPRPAAPAKPPPGVSPIASATKPAPGPDEAEMRRVYERYVAARKKNNEAVENVKFEKVRAQIEKMMPTLEQKHKGKRIEFDVVVKDGKVGLKPVAKDDK